MNQVRVRTLTGAKLLSQLPPGSDWRVVNGRFVVVEPNSEPYWLNADGTKEVIKPLPEFK